MTYTRLGLTVVANLMTLTLAVPSVALGGTYKVHGCRTSSGAVAPTGGWFAGSVGQWVTAEDDCASGGGLTVALNPNIAHPTNAEAKWTFVAAPNTRVVAFSGHRAASVGIGQDFGSPGVMLGVDSGFLERCIWYYGCSGEGSFGGWAASGNAFSFTGFDSSAVYFAAVCGGGGQCPAENPSALATLFRSEVTLLDPFDPQPSAPSGSLVANATHRGTEAITFNATDQGGGVYRTIVAMDGKAVSEQAIAENRSTCADAEPGNGDPNEFFEKQPCKLSVNATVGVDTTRVPDGDHTIRVTVLDAAGNIATVYGPSSFRVDNRGEAASSATGQANGSNASDVAHLRIWFVDSRSRVHTSAFGRRVVIRGRLVNERDEGIGNASLTAVRRGIAYRLRRDKVMTLRTKSDGSFGLILAKTASSHTLRVGYRSHLEDAREATTGEVTLRVRAGIRLAIAPKSVRNGQVVVFRGRLLGKPVPRRGKLIEVQVRFPTQWRTFATIRTRRDGRFRYRYRFMRTYDPTVYRFRVRSREEAGYPYETGISRVLHVRVR